MASVSRVKLPPKWALENLFREDKVARLKGEILRKRPDLAGHATFQALLPPEVFIGGRREQCDKLKNLMRALKEGAAWDSDAIGQEVQAIYQIYQKYLREIEQEPKRKLPTPPWTVYVEGRGACLMVDKVAQHIFGQIATPGKRLVVSYGGWHWKHKPDAPGVEKMVGELRRCLFGSDPLLTKVICVGKVIWIVSKTIEGEGFDKVMEADRIDTLDSRTFSQEVICSLLANTQDGKPHNYIVTDGDSPVCCDNDMAFVYPPFFERKGSHYPNVKNIFFFLKQMDQPIDSRIRQKLLQHSPLIFLFDWLRALHEKDQDLQALTEGKEPLASIRLLKGLARRIYQKLQVMHDKMTGCPQLTHKELFKALEPELFQYYSKLQKECPAPLEACEKLYFMTPSFEELVGEEWSKESAKTAFEFIEERVEPPLSALQTFMNTVSEEEKDSLESECLAWYRGLRKIPSRIRSADVCPVALPHSPNQRSRKATSAPDMRGPVEHPPLHFSDTDKTPPSKGSPLITRREGAPPQRSSSLSSLVFSVFSAGGRSRSVAPRRKGGSSLVPASPSLTRHRGGLEVQAKLGRESL